MTATFWFGSIIISIVLTVAFAVRFELKRVPQLVLLNVLCPFAGFVYAVYVVHVVLPALVKKQTGHEIESPLQPYIDHYWALVKEKALQLFGNKKDDDKTL